MRVLAFIAALSLPTSVFAQGTSPELLGSTGVVMLWGDESYRGAGLSLGGGAGVRLSSRIGIEVLFERHENQRRFEGPNDVRFDAEALGARVRLAKYFGTSRAQPYAGGGFGVTRIESSSSFPADCRFTANNQFQCFNRNINRTITTSPTLGAFGGVRIAVGRVLFVRPEFEVSRTGEHLKMTTMVAAGWAW